MLPEEEEALQALPDSAKRKINEAASSVSTWQGHSFFYDEENCHAAWPQSRCSVPGFGDPTGPTLRTRRGTTRDRIGLLQAQFPDAELNSVPDLKRIQRFVKEHYAVPENVYSSLRKFLRHVPGLRPDARAFGEALPTHVRRAKRRMSSYEKKHWMPWSEVVGKVDALVARITKARPLRQIARETMVDALLLALYVYAEAPRRNEYRTMRTTDDGTSNYVDQRRKQFVFRQYKTAHAYGEQRVDIPARLMTVLRLHRKRCGRTAYLLGDRPWSTSTFSNRVRAASKLGARQVHRQPVPAQDVRDRPVLEAHGTHAKVERGRPQSAGDTAPGPRDRVQEHGEQPVATAPQLHQGGGPDRAEDEGQV